MQPSDPILIYRQVIAAISRGDADALDALLAEHILDNNPIPNQSPGRAGFKEWMTTARSSFPDLQGTIEDVIASGDRVAGNAARPVCGAATDEQASRVFSHAYRPV
jgi:predicted ester cyclase